MRYLLGSLVCLMLIDGIAMGQRAAGEPRAKPMVKPAAKTRVARAAVNTSMLEATAAEITEARPEVSEQTLVDDAEVIEDSAIAIQTALHRRGYLDPQVREATMDGWKALRIKKLEPAASLTTAEFIRFVCTLGRLVIRTTPAGATIEIDGEVIRDRQGRMAKTESCRWPSTGPHRIKLTLAGYETVEEDYVVNEEENVFERSLKPAEKKTPK